MSDFTPYIPTVSALVVAGLGIWGAVLVQSRVAKWNRERERIGALRIAYAELGAAVFDRVNTGFSLIDANLRKAHLPQDRVADPDRRQVENEIENHTRESSSSESRVRVSMMRVRMLDRDFNRVRQLRDQLREINDWLRGALKSPTHFKPEEFPANVRKAFAPFDEWFSVVAEQIREEEKIAG